MYSYDAIFRKNYEGIAFSAWAASGAIAAAVPVVTGAPASMYVAVSFATACMAARRLPKALQLFSIRRKLRGQPLSFITPSKLRRILNRHRDSLWLGYGYEWDQQQTQLANDILKRSKKALGLKRKQADATGLSWIHGIGLQEEEIGQPLKHTEGHWLITGTTGSGKTRCFDHLITQSIYRGEPVVIIDPKGDKDLCESARLACEQIGHPERFVYFHPAYPEKSARLDPLYNFNRGTELATRIAVLIPGGTDSGPFTAFGQMALNNIIQGQLMAGKQPTLASIRSYVEGGSDQLVVKAIAAYCDAVMPEWEFHAGSHLANANTDEQKAKGMVSFYRKVIMPRHPNPDIEGLISNFTHDREHFQKMVASLLPVLAMLTSGDMGPLLSPNRNDAEDDRIITDLGTAIRNNQVVYVGLDSLSDAMVGSAIGTMLTSDLTAVAGDRYNFGDGNAKKLNLFIDEAAECLSDSTITLLNKSRGSGFRIYIATQTFSDFAAKLGDENKARQVLGNVNNKLTLRVTDAKTQEYICDSLPETRINWVMTTQGTGSSQSATDTHSGNVGERLMEEAVPMIPSQLLGLLPNLEYFAVLVDGRLLKGRLPILDKTGARQ